MAAPSVTGSIEAHNSGSNSLVTGTLNVTGTNLIAVVVGTEKAIGTTISVSSITGTGLTFTKRFDYTNNFSSIPYRLELWTSPVGGTNAFNGTLTVNVSGTSDSIIAIPFGVGGLNAGNSSHFDTNVGLPFENTSAGTPAVTVNTSFANDLLISMDHMGGGGTNEPAGFTEIQQGFTFATNFARLKVAYKQVTATQTGLTVTPGSSGDQSFVVDAFTADANNVGFTAAPALGATMAAALTLEGQLIASPALGVTMAVTLQRSNNLSASAGLGTSMAAALSHVAAAHRQPIICVVT